MKLIHQTPHFALDMVMIILITLLAACSSAAAEVISTPTSVAQIKLVISGSGGTSTILKYLANAYTEKHHDLTFDLLSGSGTSGGVKGALDGTLDLGAMARPPKDEELNQGLKYLHFATERIAFVTSADVSLNGLTSQQVKDIFSGQITNWSEVGGPNTPINLLVRDEEESNTQILREALFGETPFPAGAAVFTGEGDLRKALVSVHNAIAYVSYGGLRLEKTPANVVVFDGLDPANLNQNYPYAKPAGLGYTQANVTKVQPFLDYVISEEARNLLTEQGIIPAKIISQK